MKDSNHLLYLSLSPLKRSKTTKATAKGPFTNRHHCQSFLKTWLKYLTIPEDFGDFDNNIDWIRAALWYDGDQSKIFDWADRNYDESPSFGMPISNVFLAEVSFIDDIKTNEGMLLCFDNGI